MKLIATFAAGLVAAAAVTPVAAPAQMTTRTTTTTVRHAPAARWRWKNVCTTRWVGHRKVRRCTRTHVRY